MTRLPRSLATAALLLRLVAPGTASATPTLQITAGYDYASPTYLANTFFTIHNGSADALTSIVFTATGDGGAGSSDVATWIWSIASISAGDTGTLYFPLDGSGVTGTGYGFTSDYEFLIEGNDQNYLFSGVVDGVTYTAQFSPAANASETFVGFLGNDVDGDALPANASALVATTDVTSQVPEPPVIWLSIAGLVAYGLHRRRAGQRTLPASQGCGASGSRSVA